MALERKGLPTEQQQDRLLVGKSLTGIKGRYLRRDVDFRPDITVST